LAQDISEKELKIFNLEKAQKDTDQKLDALTKENQGMKDLLTMARREIQTRDSSVSELKTALQNLTFKADDSVKEQVASKLSAIRAEQQLDLNAKNSKIADLEGKLADLQKRLANRSERDCAPYDQKLQEQASTIAQAQERARRAEETARKCEETRARAYLRDRDVEPEAQAQPQALAPRPRRAILSGLRNWGWASTQLDEDDRTLH
jgi:chromosome segregation ATPase